MARGLARLIGRLLLRGVPLLVLFVLALAVLGNAGITRTQAGRAFVLDLALEQTDALFRGKLAARELSELGVTSVTLRGVTMTDPTGRRVIEAERIVLELSPLAFVRHGAIHVDRVAIEHARVDLADLGTERGVIAAFALREPSPPSPSEPASKPPVIVVDALELSVEVTADQLRQPVRIALDASGTLDAIDAGVQLSSGAGDVALQAKLLDLDCVELTVASKGVTPGGLWAGAPDERIAFELTGVARIAEQALHDLKLHAQWRSVDLDLSGDATAKQLNLAGTVRARDFELAEASAQALDADFTAVGPPTALHGSVELRGTRLRYQNVGLDRLALKVSGGPKRFDVSLEAGAPEGHVQLTTQVELQEQAVELDASARGALRQRPFGLQVQHARIGFGGAVEVQHAVLDGLGQRVVLHGRYGAAERDRLELEAKLDLTALSDAFALEPLLSGRAELELRASGTVERPRAELSVRAQQLGLREPARAPRPKRPTLDAVLSATLDTKKGELTAKAKLDSGRELHLDTQLSARFNSKKAPWHRQLLASNVQGTLTLAALSSEWIDAWLPEPLPIRGSVGANATFAGTLERPELTLSTHAQLRHPKRAVTYELDVETRYAAAAAELTLTVRDPQGPLVQASAALEHPAATLAQFLAPGAALLDEASWKAALELTPRTLGALPIDAFTPEPLDPQLAAITAGLSLSASHAPHQEPSASATLHALRSARGATKLRIAAQDHQCPDQPLELSVTTELAQGKLDVRAKVASAQLPLFDATAKATLVLSPALSGRGAPAVSEAGALVQLSEIELGSLPRLCGLVQGRLGGRIEADALLGDAPRVRVQLQGKKIGFDGSQGIDLELLASATPAEAKLDVGLHHGETQSTITAHLPIRWQGSDFELLRDQPIGAKLALERLPVMSLLPQSVAVSRASGYLSGAVSASGTLDDPRVTGWIEPEGVALTVTGLAQPLHGIEGRVAFSNRRILIERLVAKDRDGSVTLKGSAELLENHDVTAKLSVKADGFPLRQQGQIAGEVDAQIDVAARITETRTRIDVTMKDASAWLLGGQLRRGISLDAHPDIRDPRAAKPDPEVELEEPSSEAPARPVVISINAQDSFWVRRDDFAVKLSTKIELRIEDGQVAATGPIQIHRGYLQLFGQTFDIDGKSKVDLTGGTPPDPVLDITADTLNRASGKKISVNIGGRASAPVLTFFIDDVEANAGEAATAMFGGRGNSGGGTAEGEAKSFVAGMMAGVMAMSARRELGDAMPILMIEPADDMAASRVRAGFELDKLVPGFLEGMIRGVYVEGIFAGGSEDENASSSGVQGGVLLELYLPHNLVTSGQYGPGETWSVDLGWEP